MPLPVWKFRDACHCRRQTSRTWCLRFRRVRKGGIVAPSKVGDRSDEDAHAHGRAAFYFQKRKRRRDAKGAKSSRVWCGDGSARPKSAITGPDRPSKMLAGDREIRSRHACAALRICCVARRARLDRSSFGYHVRMSPQPLDRRAQPTLGVHDPDHLSRERQPQHERDRAADTRTDVLDREPQSGD